MSKVVFIDDNPIGNGGAELVNDVLRRRYVDEALKSDEVHTLRKDDFYILGNLSLMHSDAVKSLSKLNYIILEHDYKICKSRHPWRYDDNIVPKEERINYELYEKAEAVFVQTTDHLDIFKKNDVKGNFVNLESSLWEVGDLNLLEKYNSTTPRNWKCGILDSSNWIKNTEGAEVFCKANQLDYELIKSSNNREEFIKSLAQYSTLVFFPIARESCCRLVVEARCMSMNVLTSRNYGAVLEEWFTLSGKPLIDLLSKNTERNLKIIEGYIPC